MANHRDEVGSGPDENEPKSITIEGRNFANASYGATEKEQTDDVRGRNSAARGDVADGGISDRLDDDGRE